MKEFDTVEELRKTEPAFAAFASPIWNGIPWVKANSARTHIITYTGDFFAKARDVSKHPQQVAFNLSGPASESDVIRQMFSGNGWVNPDDATGLREYYGSTSLSEAQNAANVIDAQGRGASVKSIYLVVWGRDVHMAWNADQDGKLRAAIIPGDWRYIVRIANIDPHRTDISLITCMQKAMLRVPTYADSARFYMGEDIAGLVRQQTEISVLSTLFGAMVQIVDVLDGPERPIGKLSA